MSSDLSAESLISISQSSTGSLGTAELHFGASLMSLSGREGRPDDSEDDGDEGEEPEGSGNMTPGGPHGTPVGP